LKHVKFDKESYSLVFSNGVKVRVDKNYDTFHVSAEEIATEHLGSILAALKDAYEHLSSEGRSIEVALFAEYDPRDLNTLSDWEVDRLWNGEAISMTRTHAILARVDESTSTEMIIGVDFPYTDDKEEATGRVVDYIRHSLGEITDFQYYSGISEAPAWSITVTPSDLNLTMAHCIEVAHCLESLLRYRDMDPQTPAGVMALLLTKQVSFLIGRPESDWLEAKRSYGISDQLQKHEFACDVASFANTPSGGLILIGAKTEKDQRGRDIITSLTPCRAGSINVQTYQQAVTDRVIPEIEGLSFDVIEVTGGDLLAVQIPKQEEARMPFIVKGGVIDSNASKIRTTSFSVPVRRSADTKHMSPEWVHSLLVSGRAFLNGSAS
jgi:hypothetical protein